jgi:hypothetical protein
VNNLDYEVPTFEQMPHLMAHQSLPPSTEGSPFQNGQHTVTLTEPKPEISTEQLIMPLTPALSQVIFVVIISRNSC